MNKTEVKNILVDHHNWLLGNGGQRANLQGADLRGAYLLGAYLQGANLQGANLQGANLRGANLRGADLRGVDLRGADFQRADLQRAGLQCVNLQCVNLQNADLRGAKLPVFTLCPEGKFTAWKTVLSKHEYIIVKLEILGKRTSSLVGRKCRTDKARVLQLYTLEGKIFKGEGYSDYNPEFKYRKGDIVTEPDYDDDIRVECTKGIHFFISKQEAIDYFGSFL